MADIRGEIDMPDPSDVTQDEIEKWHAMKRTAEKQRALAGRYLEKLEIYAERIESLRVLDPACGIGGLLIQALHRLLRERRWLAQERERVEKGARRAFDDDAAIRSTLSHNLYGVDTDAESVEMTKRALWSHAAAPGRPPRDLDRMIRTGNSLVDISFDWASAFPEVFAQGGFDCIVGNPPYVKYQHLRTVDVGFAEYLRTARTREGTRLYASTGRGNFDLYLPFIEKGISLLHPRGCMGYIAPSLWIKHAHGEGLRRLIRKRQCLERWVDLGDFQVFEDATTYTALQFFTGAPVSSVQYQLRATGALSDLEWEGPSVSVIPYASIAEQGAWNFVGTEDADLFRRMALAHPTLGTMVGAISVGVQTSADSIFHLQEITPGTYRNDDGEFQLEPSIMRPIVSGQDVRRYVKPCTQGRILFPYARTDHGVELLSAPSMKRDFPHAWAYLRRYEQRLRAREGGKFDDEQWYRFGRNQNIEKQHLRKILVRRLVQQLALAPDLEGEFVADNVDVCYLIVEDVSVMWYVLGVLNSTFPDYYFRRTSKPFRGGYLSANKQYLAPLPIPDAKGKGKEQTQIVNLAKKLWMLHGLEGKIDELQDQITATERKLDEIVFQLYGLSQTDIARVQGRT